MERTLPEILEAREQRAFRQQALLDRFQKPLLCFTMNIPGPDKTGELVEKGFQLGNRLLKRSLPQQSIAHFEQRSTAAGWEAFYVVDIPAITLKETCVYLEDKIPGGRVFDMDVLTAKVEKVSRESVGAKRRKCLLCGNDAAACGRSRNHSLQALQEKTFTILQEGLCWEISQLAVQSLLCEVYATPKPGLVDQNNNGSHADMDLMLFLKSSAVLWRYFYRCCEIGLNSSTPAAVFEKLRSAGREAETNMLLATGGVNTHKGAIFALGILCGAAGMLPPEQWEDPAALSAQCSLITNGIVRKDYRLMESPETVGQRLFRQYGITGARGQAEAGFPAALLVGLPVLEEGLKKGLSFNDSLCAALLHIICSTWDTNLIKRGGMAAFGQIQAVLQSLLRITPYPTREVLEDLDRTFMKQNLSPGGSADLLSAACFFYFLKNP